MTTNEIKLRKANRLFYHAVANGRMQRQRILAAIIMQLAAEQAQMSLAGLGI